MLQLLQLPNLWWVVCGASLLGACLGGVGAYCFLKRESLIGDVLSHAALPGVTTMFLIFQSRHPAMILAGALVSCFIASYLLRVITKSTRLKVDAVLAILLSGGFAVGIFQLSIIQHMEGARSAGLDRILFGQAAALRYNDLIFYLSVSGVLLSLLWLYSRELAVSVFDPQLGKTLGIPVDRFRMFLSAAAAVATAISLDLAGVVLVAALLITPAAAARLWVRSVSGLVLLAAILGALSGVIGSLVSSTRAGMPTGPWIVVVASLIFVWSVTFARGTGMIPRFLKRRKLSRVIAKENILRSAYGYLEERGAERVVTLSYVAEQRSLSQKVLGRLVTAMARDGLIVQGVAQGDESITLTDAGFRIAEKLTRYHRLWELYLSTYILMPETHLHADAEEAEHFLDEHLAEALAASLPDPELDPHGKTIPVLATEGET